MPSDCKWVIVLSLIKKKRNRDIVGFYVKNLQFGTFGALKRKCTHYDSVLYRAIWIECEHCDCVGLYEGNVDIVTELGSIKRMWTL